MKHIVAIMLMVASGYSIVIRHENFLASRSAIARAHAAKVREIKAELERSGGDEYHKKMADQCADFITWQREEWFRKNTEYAHLSNGVIVTTLLYLGMAYLKRRKKPPDQEMERYG